MFHNEMEAPTMDPAEEPPSMLWGLDPIFSAFARLYVRDILQMTESTQVPVDDGTGVINCLCWKNDLFKEEENSSKSVKLSDGGFNPVSELKKLRQAQQSRCRLEIGELLRVRGPVKTSRQQREIMASCFYKVNDQVMAVQIAWMMEVPQLYRQCYDKPLQLQPTATGSIGKATNIIKDFFKQKSVSRFRPYDVQDLLQPLIPRQPQTAPADQEPVAGPSACQQLRQLLKEALKILQDEGDCTGQDLLIAIKDILREDCKREKYAEKGCHILHILSAVRQRYSLNVSRAALELVLKSLECNSDVVSTSDSHYTVF
ncbi:hypothetical protein F7725_005280 [Dissostichus mawsoni]|uniref:CST complex subunit STN1 n=1 Tax=Dissostichus mawsoni TaxID=36200 RepID=A0A7J5YR53_DISMA|nr:hypothetical protein F7725_005280 [Dissostichus mawsoni]